MRYGVPAATPVLQATSSPYDNFLKATGQLNDNQLVGSIPSELGKLEQLFELNFANNNMEEPIPSNISLCTALNQL
ncbi:hypothetical protein RJ641_027481 [Dillenia turbinata]|uniref:Uncharacterized protein n=1 Tax=Dillenia turbinata TaxID=194707 RepID=A0AAN8ZI65_9MAGN